MPKALKANQFAVELNNYIRVDVYQDLFKIQRAVALDFLAALVKATPVGNPDLWDSLIKDDGSRRPGPKNYVGGSARSNWFVSSGFASTKTTDDVDSADDVTAKGSAVIATVKPAPNVIWLANNLPYIVRIMEEGWSGQAPKGLFTLIFASIRSKWSTV